MVSFRGMECEEKPAKEWKSWACTHIKSFINRHGFNVQQVLVGCNKSAEVFLVVSAPENELAKILPSEIKPPLTQVRNHISCGQCWVDLYANGNL